METPPKISHEISEFLWNIFEFFVRNLFGVMSALAGIAYQIYQLSGNMKRMTRTQCVTSIFMWFFISGAVVIGLENAGINRLFYGLICWLAPIVMKPIADTVSIKISPFTESVIKSIEKLLKSKLKKE